MPIFTAIVPIFLIILGGYLCRHFQFPGPNFWPGAEKITYYLLFPALLVSKMATADLEGMDFFEPIVMVVLLYLAISAFIFLCKPLAGATNAQFTSVYQGSIRFNTYIGLAVVSALYGTEGLVTAVILASLMIPVINTACVLVLEYYNGDRGSKAFHKILLSVAKNPLIIACALGMGINFSNLAVPAVIIETLNIFARTALPMGLLTVGAALTLSTIKTTQQPILFACIAKFMVLPAIAMGLCELFQIEAMVRNAMLVLTALPTAAASYVMAKQMGGDYRLMATIITVQTLLSTVMIPVILLVFSG